MIKLKSVSGRIRPLRWALGVNRREFAGLLGFSERAIAGWETGDILSAHPIQRLLEFERLGQRLEVTVGCDHVANWLREPRSMWGGRSAFEVIESGEIDRVWE